MAIKLSHSYSAIKLYDNCPLRYFRQRVVKDVTDEAGEASVHGERVHASLEKRLTEKTPLPKELEGHEEVCRALEVISNDSGGKLLIEHELTLNENLEPTTWWAPDAWIRSKLDVLVLRKKDAVVVDWKTGARRPDMFQMRMFAAQVFKHYEDVKSIRVALVWLKHNTTDKEVFTRSQTNELWTEIMSKIGRIYKSLEHDKWPAKPSGLCRYCPARHDCNFAKL
jgi:hypothetical protein